MWKRRIIQGLWILAGTGTLALLVAAMQKKSARACVDTQVEIAGAAGNDFISVADIQEILKQEGSFAGASMAGVNLRKIEEDLEKDPWIRNAELFFDNRRVLQVRITEREPVARVFTITGNSFYLDSSGKVLPLSDKLSARVPVFTGFPFEKAVTPADTVLVKSVICLGNYIAADSFWNAQVAQVDITPSGFDMVPVIGDHIIHFGDTTGMDKKFRKLFSFYKNVSAKVGFDKYEAINLAYDGQVVAVRRGAAAPSADSATAMQQLQRSMETMTMQPVNDSTRTHSVAVNSDRVMQQRQPKAVMNRRQEPQRH